MATFRNRNGKWQARIVRKGQQPVSKTFSNKQDAERWARQVETQIDRGCFISTATAERTTFKELVERYVREVVPTMRGAGHDAIRLRALQRRPICNLNMTALTPARVAEYRDQRLLQVSTGTVIRELAYLSAIINHARREWDINIENPVRLVRKPQTPQARSRLLDQAEKQNLLEALTPCPTKRVSPWMKPLVEFAVETAMRRGEMLALLWGHIDFESRTAYLPLTKNGDARTVPLSSRAIEILQSLPHSICGRVFPIKPQTVAAAFMKASKRAGLEDFHFHDLRRTATTMLAGKLSNLIELAAVTGHRNLHMLRRYYQPNAQDLAQKIR